MNKIILTLGCVSLSIISSALAEKIEFFNHTSNTYSATLVRKPTVPNWCIDLPENTKLSISPASKAGDIAVTPLLFSTKTGAYQPPCSYAEFHIKITETKGGGTCTAEWYKKGTKTPDDIRLSGDCDNMKIKSVRYDQIVINR